MISNIVGMGKKRTVIRMFEFDVVLHRQLINKALFLCSGSIKNLKMSRRIQFWLEISHPPRLS